MASTEALEQYNYTHIYVHHPSKTLHSLIMAMSAFLKEDLIVDPGQTHRARARERCVVDLVVHNFCTEKVVIKIPLKQQSQAGQC